MHDKCKSCCSVLALFEHGFRATFRRVPTSNCGSISFQWLKITGGARLEKKLIANLVSHLEAVQS